MGNNKRNLAVFFYLLAVLGLGLSSLFIGRRVADRQREITPQEAEAAREECVECCWQEWGPYAGICPIVDGVQTSCMKDGCKQCKLQNPDNCDSNANVWPSDCWVPACEPPPPPPTATPTPIPTSTPIPTPTPLPGCWGVCTVDTNCPQNTTPPLVCPGGRCVNPNCPTEQDCTCPPLLCLGLTATPSAQILKKGDDVEFACKGSYGTGSINHVEFRIQVNDGAWQNLGTAPVTQVSGEYQGVKSYKVPDAGNYRVECRTCTSTNETVCTNWGLAQ